MDLFANDFIVGRAGGSILAASVLVPSVLAAVVAVILVTLFSVYISITNKQDTLYGVPRDFP